MQAVFEEYIPIVLILKKLEADATACGLLKKMNSVVFVGLVYILHFVLPILAKVSRLFQKGHVSFAAVGPTLEMAKTDLISLATEYTPIRLLESELKQGHRLGLIQLNITEYHKSQLERTLVKYVQALSSNLDERFPDVPLTTAFSIFNPTLPEKCSSEFKIYGNDYVKTIHQHFLGAESDTEHEIVCEWNLMKYQI